MDLCNMKTIRDIMSIFHLSAKKEYGQNFLTDSSVVADIADSCYGADTILEIGPGLGVLTRELAARYPTVKALEIDDKLLPVLKYTLNDMPNATVIHGDVMKADLNEILAEDFAKGSVSVCANLPYYITSPILMKLLESELPFEYITVMVQKEVALRLCAGAGGKDCGAITVAVAYRGDAELLFTVPADRFFPAPKVDSAVVRIRLHKEKPVVPHDEETFFATVRAAFSQRRKTLLNSLSTGFSQIPKEKLAEFIAALGLRADIRGEKLTLKQFADLSDLIFAEIKK